MPRQFVFKFFFVQVRSNSSQEAVPMVTDNHDHTTDNNNQRPGVAWRSSNAGRRRRCGAAAATATWLTIVILLMRAHALIFESNLSSTKLCYCPLQLKNA